MKQGNKQKRNRFIALSFVSVLLLLVYGPLAQWFTAADRTLYDLLASSVPNKPLQNAYIVSIDPATRSRESLLDDYGKIIGTLKQSKAKRIIMAEPPEFGMDEELPGWAATLSSGIPVYVPTRHRFAPLAKNDGFVNITPDSDNVLRQSELWYLNGGMMSPSLPLAIAFDNPDAGSNDAISGADDAIYFSTYAEIPRIDAEDLARDRYDLSMLDGATIFVDAAPALVAAALPLARRAVASLARTNKHRRPLAVRVR